MSRPSTAHYQSSKKQKHQEQLEIRQKFLHEFVAAMIRVAKRQREAKLHEDFPTFDKPTAPRQPIPVAHKPTQGMHYTQQSSSRMQPKVSHALIPTLASQAPVAPQLEAKPEPVRMPLPPPTPSLQKITLTGLAGIQPYLNDPGVRSVECQGPNKPLLLYKNGTIQATKVMLTGEQIDAIIKEISEMTRIPILPGVFKTAINDLIVTAVISEFVGSRFIIQKNPSKPGQPNR